MKQSNKSECAQSLNWIISFHNQRHHWVRFASYWTDKEKRHPGTKPVVVNYLEIDNVLGRTLASEESIMLLMYMHASPNVDKTGQTYLFLSGFFPFLWTWMSFCVK